MYRFRSTRSVILTCVLLAATTLTAGAEEAGVSGDAILFGQAAAMEGPSSALGQRMRQGIVAAFTEINAKGGVHGRKLQLISRDDGYDPDRSAAETLRQKFRAGEKTGILFGRERWGLTNEEVALADEIVTFPVNPAFASLNIAQAVLLMSYEWMKSGLEDLAETAFLPIEQRPSTKEQVLGLFEHLEEALDARNYFHPPSKKPRMVDNLRAVISRRGFTEQEISVFRGVINSLDRFPRRWPKQEKPGDQEPSAAETSKADDAEA